MGHRTRFLFSLLAIVAIAAACGGSKKDTASTGDTSTTAAAATGSTAGNTATSTVAEGPCAALLQANIETAVGMAMGPATPGTDNGSTAICTWQSADHNTNVNVVKYQRANDLLKNFKAADANATDLPGVGDDAVIDAKLGRVSIQIGEIGLTISITPAPSGAALTTLAKTATPG